ncbi:hypothetical protein GCM10020229_39390 [Kitasatospora albolonga]|uniref:hypothetical protein n=1 Tax=Kitasatospora albolonga TaxID=68173 RepID=UPI0031E8483E
MPATASAAPAVASGPVTCAHRDLVRRPALRLAAADGGGLAGLARLTSTSAQPVLVKVELKTQRAWGSPWLTVSSTTPLRTGTASVSTPKVVTNELSIVCVTTAPALTPEQQTTFCTHPSA